MITGVTQFGSFQADGQGGARFTAHLGGAFRADGSGGGEFLVALPGRPLSALTATGEPPPPAAATGRSEPPREMPTRSQLAPVDFQLQAGGLLGADHTLAVKVGSRLRWRRSVPPLR